MVTSQEHAPPTTRPAGHAAEPEPEPEAPPLRGYAGMIAGYGVAVAGLLFAGRATGRRAPALDALDLATLALATHKVARLLGKASVTSPLRAPFVIPEGPAGEGEVNERVRSHPMWRHVVGESLTCPFCLGVWVATGLVAGHAFAPGFGRLVTRTFSAVALSDFLQVAYARARP